MSGGSFEEISMDFQQCLHRMHSNWQLAPELMWEQDLPKVSPKTDRERKLHDIAAQAFSGMSNVFIDCASSLQRPTHAAFAVPCITPRHQIYSIELGRYLTIKDLLNAQGFWESCFSPATYRHLLSNPDLAQDIIGNAFSSTVFQAVFIAGLVAAPHAWDTVPEAPSTDMALDTGSARLDEVAQGVILRRLKKKRPAPEFGPSKVSFVKQGEGSKSRKQMVKKKGVVEKSKKYKRKRRNVDSRKFSKGKKPEATIWDKEQ